MTVSLQVNLFDATDGTVIDGDAVGSTDAETARRDFRETVLAYFETGADGGQIRCLFAASEGEGDARPVLAQARWDHDGYAGVDKPAWANFTQFVVGEIQTSNWSFVGDGLTENVFKKLNNRTIDPTEAGDSQLDRPLGDDTAHIRAPSTTTAVAVFNHFARREYDVPFSVAVCESVPAHLQDSLTVLVTTDDELAKPVVERFENVGTGSSLHSESGASGGSRSEPTASGDGSAEPTAVESARAGGDSTDADGDADADADGDGDADAEKSADTIPASKSQSEADSTTVDDAELDTDANTDDVPPAVGGSRRAVDTDSNVPRGSPRADELPDRADRGADDGDDPVGNDSNRPAGGTDGESATGDSTPQTEPADRQPDGVNLPGEASPNDEFAADESPAEPPADESPDESADDLADEEFPLLDDEEADAFLSGESPDGTVPTGGTEADADGEHDLESDESEQTSEFDTTVDFDSGDFDADFDTDAGFDGDEFGSGVFDDSPDEFDTEPADEFDTEPTDAFDEDTDLREAVEASDSDGGFQTDADSSDAVADDSAGQHPNDGPSVGSTDDSGSPDAVTGDTATDTDGTDDTLTDDDTDGTDDRDPVAEFVAETETQPSADAIPDTIRDDTQRPEADDSDLEGSTTPVTDATDTEPADTGPNVGDTGPDAADTGPDFSDTEPEPVDSGPIGSTAPDFGEIDPDGSAVETTDAHSGRSEAITGVAPDAAYELRIYSGPTGRLQYSTERESARVDRQAKWDYDNGLSLAVVPNEGVVRAYFNASRNGPEQFLAEFRCGQVADEQLLETFVETLEATLSEQEWTLLEEAGGRQLLYNHMLAATPFDPDLSGADLDELLADGPVDFVVPTHAKAVELFRWVRQTADSETTVVVCGAGRVERTASADVVIQKDAGVGGVAVTGAAERRLDAQTLDRAVRETTDAFRTVAEAVYREGGESAVNGDAGSSGAERSDRLDTVIVDLLNDRVPTDQSLSFTAAGSRARRDETVAGWGVVSYAAAATVSLLLAVALGVFDDQLAGLATTVPLTGTLLGGSDPPGWIPTVPLGIVLFGGVAVLGAAVARPAARHPLTVGLATRVRSWWEYPPVSESTLFDGSRIELLDSTGAEETVESRLQRLRTAYDATRGDSGGYRQFVAETILTEPPLDSLSVAPRAETRRRRLSTVGGGVAVGVVLGLQTTATVYAALGAAAATPASAVTITLLAVFAVGLLTLWRRVDDSGALSLSNILDEFR